MITIVIAQDEKRIKDMLTKLLKNEGYAISDNMYGHNDVIKIEAKEKVAGAASLKDKIIELQDSLYKEKKGVLYKTILAEIEKPMIEYALERAEGNQLKAARILGINRNTIRAKIKKMNIDPDIYKV